MSVRVPPSIAISVGLHALLAVLWNVVDVSPPPPVEVAVGTVLELVEPRADEPVEIVMLDAAALAKLTTPDVTPPVATARSEVQRSEVQRSEVRRPMASIARATDPRAMEPTTEPRAPSPWLDLRKGRDLEGRGRDALRVPTAALERIAGGAEGIPRSVVETNTPGMSGIGALAPSLVTATITPGGRGSYKVDDLVFNGKIAPDGSVSIKDKRNLQHQFKSWSHIKKVLRTAGPLALLAIDFDITDALMRKKKIDPYASRKLAFLDETRDARVELGTEYRKQVLARTSEIVRQNLEAMWAMTSDPAARRTALFEMWDEVDETGEEELVAAGTAARASIIGFLRARVPAAGSTAFTASELAAFNGKRHSRAVFAPY